MPHLTKAERIVCEVLNTLQSKAQQQALLTINKFFLDKSPARFTGVKNKARGNIETLEACLQLREE